MKGILRGQIAQSEEQKAFNPGFFSADSFGVIDMARSGNLSNAWTAIWAIFIKYLTLNGSHPEIATLFFSQLLG